MSGGVKFDGGKPRTDLLPADALLSVSGVFGYGAKKYGDYNWTKGMERGRIIGAALRHIFKYMSGEKVDQESGLSHLAHFACNALMLLSYEIRGIGEAKNDFRGEY